jgi:hypothetical protein
MNTKLGIILIILMIVAAIALMLLAKTAMV